ncbi:MAG TPA: hypothetical protein VKH43_11035 [Thermoanaerobaculia bacterium]|nr:hypothetical protein [Thermoanaerobaculia bacterium]
MKRTLWMPLVLAAAAALAPACTNKQGETEAPVFITVDLQLQPGFVNVGVVAPVQVSTMHLQSHLKNPSQQDPQGFANVMCESYTVHYKRTDGGSRVPPDQTFGCGVLVPSGGAATLSNFPILPASAVQAPPLDQLLPFNGGFDRETGKAEIDTAFEITFFGHTVSGQRVQSETATGILNFNFAATAAVARNGKR